MRASRVRGNFRGQREDFGAGSRPAQIVSGKCAARSISGILEDDDRSMVSPQVPARLNNVRPEPSGHRAAPPQH